MRILLPSAKASADLLMADHAARVSLRSEETSSSTDLNFFSKAPTASAIAPSPDLNATFTRSLKERLKISPVSRSISLTSSRTFVSGLISNSFGWLEASKRAFIFGLSLFWFVKTSKTAELSSSEGSIPILNILSYAAPSSAFRSFMPFPKYFNIFPGPVPLTKPGAVPTTVPDAGVRTPPSPAVIRGFGVKPSCKVVAAS